MAEIRVGEPDVSPDAPAHTRGVREGNTRGAYRHEVGHHMDDTVDARKSTGVRPQDRDPILPSMPNLPPG